MSILVLILTVVRFLYAVAQLAMEAKKDHQELLSNYIINLCLSTISMTITIIIAIINTKNISLFSYRDFTPCFLMILLSLSFPCRGVPGEMHKLQV